MSSSSTAFRWRRLEAVHLIVLFLAAPLVAAHSGNHSPSCPFSSTAVGSDLHHQGEDDGHRHHLDHHDHHHHHEEVRPRKLPEEFAEEEVLIFYGWEHRHDRHNHHHSHGEHESEPSTFGALMRAMGCSLLVSLASLICLIILPVIFVRGKSSQLAVYFLALFGAGVAQGDACLHQLSHAFGGHSHSHDYHDRHLEQGHSYSHYHRDHYLEHEHSNSLKDLSVGLSFLFGIVLFSSG